MSEEGGEEREGRGRRGRWEKAEGLELQIVVEEGGMEVGEGRRGRAVARKKAVYSRTDLCFFFYYI